MRLMSEGKKSWGLTLQVVCGDKLSYFWSQKSSLLMVVAVV